MRVSLVIQPAMIALALLAAGFNAGCASQPEAESTDEPEQKTIRLPDPDKVSPGQPLTIDQTEQKPLLEIRLSDNDIEVNGTAVADEPALEKILAKHPEPVITIASHRCFSGERAAKIISLAQDYTTTPIAIGSFGDYSDPECQ